MLAPALAVGPHRDDDVGPDHPDDPHVIVEDLLPAPLLEALVHAEGVAEVDGAGEVLLGAVVAVHGLQLGGAQHAQRLEQLGANLVLAARAAGGREQDGAHPLAAVELCEQAVVLVVRVGGRLEEDANVAELPKGDAECGAAALWRRPALLGGGGQNGRDHRRGDEERERLAHMRVRDRGSRDQGSGYGDHRTRPRAGAPETGYRKGRRPGKTKGAAAGPLLNSVHSTFRILARN